MKTLIIIFGLAVLIYLIFRLRDSVAGPIYAMGPMGNRPGSMHQFDITQKRKLDNSERRRIMPPEETLRTLGLKKGDIVADVGCGIGYFTFPAGQIVGPEGKVLAMDVAEEMLNEVNEGKERNQATNIETVKVTEEHLPLNNGAVNFVLACNVLHEVEELDRYVGELQRVLAVKGRLAVIDFEKKESQWGNVIKLRFKYLGIEFLGLRNFVKKRTKFIKTLDKSEIAQ